MSNNWMTSPLCEVDKLLSHEDGDGIFDDPPADPPAIAESVMMLQDHGDDNEDDFDALSGRFSQKRHIVLCCNTLYTHRHVTICISDIMWLCVVSGSPR